MTSDHECSVFQLFLMEMGFVVVTRQRVMSAILKTMMIMQDVPIGVFILTQSRNHDGVTAVYWRHSACAYLYVK